MTSSSRWDIAHAVSRQPENSGAYGQPLCLEPERA
jgi:hypothetical protein